MRSTPRMNPPVPEEKPDDWKPPEAEESECQNCGETFDRLANDPPACSQSCWVELTEGI